MASRSLRCCGHGVMLSAGLSLRVRGCGAFLSEVGSGAAFPLLVLQVWAKLVAPALDWTPQCLQRCSGSRGGVAEEDSSSPALRGGPFATQEA